MKKILLITFVSACLCQGIIAQNNAKIDADLQQEMTLRKANELIRINIILKQQYDQMEMRRKSSVLLKKEDKRTFVVGELKRFSKETQQGVMDFLSKAPAVSEIQSCWIANFINCYANIETIEKLLLHPDVLIIGFDKEQQMFPERKMAKSANSTRGIADNILKVQADQVWALGYEGDGIVVGVVDTGVNYNHADLSDHMWIHPIHPNFKYGHNFVDNNKSPMDDNGHGTHCAGTVASNGKAGTQAGVAPKALIMAIKVANNLGLTSITKICFGLEFAVEHGAHVISLSVGFLFGGEESERIQFRNTMINVLEAGVIAAVAAGNEGEINYPLNTIGAPGNCPPPWLHPDQTTTGGLSAVVCVGATDINDNIWSASSRGPVTWQSILGYNDYPYNPGIGLIRPDVCAPGVEVTSCAYNSNSGYFSISGTSMATPCVAGTMALMLSKNPELTPAEICKILETTAVRLPNQSSPKNNTFGSGRIDAYAAVQAVCPPIYFTDETVIANTTVTNNCGNIHVRNVTVQSGAKLTLDAAGITTIKSDFEVASGAELEIR